jgi:hypothetical protein
MLNFYGKHITEKVKFSSPASIAGIGMISGGWHHTANPNYVHVVIKYKDRRGRRRQASIVRKPSWGNKKMYEKRLWTGNLDRVYEIDYHFQNSRRRVIHITELTFYNQKNQRLPRKIYRPYKTRVAAYAMVYPGVWGSWKRWYFNPRAGYLACGLRTKSERNVGRKDDTAMNAVQFMYCNPNKWHQKVWAGAHPGLYGSWDAGQSCPRGYFINWMQMKFERKQGSGDDTAANRLRFRCRQASGRRQTGVYYPKSKTNWVPGEDHNFLETETSSSVAQESDLRRNKEVVTTPL